MQPNYAVRSTSSRDVEVIAIPSTLEQSNGVGSCEPSPTAFAVDELAGREINAVWRLLGHDMLRYFAKAGDRNLAGLAKSPSHFLDLISKNPGFNWYITLNPTRACAPPKARARDVLAWAWILLDFDPLNREADPRAALDFTLDKHGLRDYCAILDSGRGCQAWVRLVPTALGKQGTPYDKQGPGAPLRSQVEGAISAWLRSLDDFVYGCRIDPSCRDLSRVARCPGTVNSRTGRPARLMSVPSQELDPSGILAAAPREQARESFPLDSHLTLSSLLPRLTETAARFLTEGHISPGRHSACYAAARSCAEAGLPLEQALVLIERGAALSRPPLPIRDSIRATRTAYERTS